MQSIIRTKTRHDNTAAAAEAEEDANPPNIKPSKFAPNKPLPKSQVLSARRKQGGTSPSLSSLSSSSSPLSPRQHYLQFDAL
ncbi:hypothetical protein BASA81_006865 [Batrachochytrium salamandrivorans]|nr:hypothetical protein BASA81_006865 [Batrachochytrium salamandrivorans]